MKLARGTLVLSICVASVACSDRVSSPTLAAPAPRATLNDGAHGGTAGFYFLPPMLPQPSARGTFDPNLAPVVTLCRLRGDRCAETVAEYTRSAAPGGTRVQLKVSEAHYMVDWDTRATRSAPGDTVRITVSFKLQ